MGILNAGLVKELRLILPPLGVQERFELALSKVDQLFQKFQQSNVECGALFTSLQHRAFRGEL